MARDLRDKVIAITGASSGIGAATAVECARAGMRVALAARREEKLREVVAQVEALGRRALAVRCDVDRDDDVAALVAQTVSHFGRLDAVFANAGFGVVRPVLDTPDEEIRAIFETNFYGTVRTLKAARDPLKQTADGLRHMLVCSSSAAEFAPPLYGVYAATKAAQDSICGAMRAELHREGLIVSSVHPVGTYTGFFEAAKRPANDEPGKDPILLNTPRMFMQESGHVARAVVKCLRRPRPEVWPMPLTRFGLAIATAFPSLAAKTALRMTRGR
jgi:NAD(P)-dependent dehydrogenase (short-subunit alcohol dehydrogenase family)